MTDADAAERHDSPAEPSGRRSSRRPAKGGAGHDGGRGAPGGKRHQARILALQVLFEVDLTNHPPEEVLARTWADQPAPADSRAFVERLVRGALADQERIDRYVAVAAPAFPVPQLPSVDRNVLRIAIYELLRERDVPPKAAINEAVELAKRFGGDSSSRFVNGVLGTVVETLQRERGDTAPGDPPSPRS